MRYSVQYWNQGFSGLFLLQDWLVWNRLRSNSLVAIACSNRVAIRLRWSLGLMSTLP